MADSNNKENIFENFQSAVHFSEDLKNTHVFTVMGASGDLAKKKIYPTLWWLYRDNLLPDKTLFLGYARSKLNIQEFLTKTAYQFMKVKPQEEEMFSKFVSKNYYLAGSYDKEESFQELSNKIVEIGQMNDADAEDCNRLFYLALPPSVYTSVTELLSKNCKAKK